MMIYTEKRIDSKHEPFQLKVKFMNALLIKFISLKLQHFNKYLIKLLQTFSQVIVDWTISPVEDNIELIGH